MNEEYYSRQSWVAKPAGDFLEYSLKKSPIATIHGTVFSNEDFIAFFDVEDGHLGVLISKTLGVLYLCEHNRKVLGLTNEPR